MTSLRDGSGNVVERYQYDPLGSPTYIDSSWGSRSSSSYAWSYLWQGLKLDTVAGLYNARNRDIHPTLARTLQRDPLGFDAGDMNLYRWEGNNSPNVNDPQGLWWIPPPEVTEGWTEEDYAAWDAQPKASLNDAGAGRDWWQRAGDSYGKWLQGFLHAGKKRLDAFKNDPLGTLWNMTSLSQISKIPKRIGTAYEEISTWGDPNNYVPITKVVLDGYNGLAQSWEENPEGVVGEATCMIVEAIIFKKAGDRFAPKMGGTGKSKQVCFAAGTPIRTSDGSIAIEKITAGMQVLSRDEFDPNGSVIAKLVEEVFVRLSPTLEFTVEGRIINATLEHPFWVMAKDA